LLLVADGECGDQPSLLEVEVEKVASDSEPRTTSSLWPLRSPKTLSVRPKISLKKSRPCRNRRRPPRVCDRPGRLVVGVRPVLDAATTVEEGVVEVGYVAGRIGVGHARLESLTDDDAVIELDAAPCEKIDDWLGADVGDDEIGRQPFANLRLDRVDVGAAAKSSNLVGRRSFTSWSAKKIATSRSSSDASRAWKRPLARLMSVCPRGRCDGVKRPARA
jgi:hypothetical protein